MCKELGLKELAGQYNVSEVTFSKYIDPIRKKLLAVSPNKKRLRIFTPKMVEMVFELLGDPGQKNSFKQT